MAGNVTAALPRGRTSALRLADQVDIPTQAAAGYFEVNTYAATFNKKRPLDDDDITGQAGYANTTDSRPAAPGVEDADGTMSVPLDLLQLGFWLKGLLGVEPAAPTANGAAFDHTFKSGAVSLPARTLERQFNATQLEAMIGALVKDATFPIGADKGYAQVDLSLWGRQVTDPYAASVAGAPTVVALAARVPKSSGLLKLNGTNIGRVTTGNLKITNDIQSDRYAGDYLQSDAFLQGVAAQLSITARYTNDALRSAGVTIQGSVLPAVQAMELDYILSPALKLVFTLPAVRFEPVTAPITNGGLITVQMSGRAEVGAAAPMLTAVLTNAQAAAY